MSRTVCRKVLFGYLIGVIICLIQIKTEEVSLTPEDFEDLDKYQPSEEAMNLIDPIVEGGFEGDIILNDEQRLQLIPGLHFNAISNVSSKWPNGIVPYRFLSEYNHIERKFFAKAFEHIQYHTCIRFVKKNSSHSDYIEFTNETRACFSNVGRQGGNQTVNLHQICMKMGIIAHELMHALGLFHEQCRNDRDKYVRVYEDNIKEANKLAFKKHSLGEITHLGTPYDYGSLMHYSRFIFSKNDKPTMVPLQPGIWTGQRRAMSHNDILKLNRHYDCYGYPGVGTATDKCRDEINNCIDYIHRYKCEEALTQCKRTCGRCKGDPNKKLQTIKPGSRGNRAQIQIPNAAGPCEDLIKNCMEYYRASRCQLVIGKCNKTCGLCEDIHSTTMSSSSSCRDIDNVCADLRQNNQCKYVWRSCKRTCGKCEPNMTTAHPTKKPSMTTAHPTKKLSMTIAHLIKKPSSCHDGMKDCDRFYKFNQCHLIFPWCNQSCGVC